MNNADVSQNEVGCGSLSSQSDVSSNTDEDCETATSQAEVSLASS